MNQNRIFGFLNKGASLLLLCFATSSGYPGEDTVSRYLVEGLSIEATPAVLDESGICLEAHHYWRLASEVGLEVRIPIVSPVGKAVDFDVEVRQGPGRRMTTSTLLGDYDGKWAPPAYVSFWDLSDPASTVLMTVGYKNDKTGKLTHIRFTNLKLKSLLAIDLTEKDSSKTYRAGCRRWDLENRK